MDIIELGAVGDLVGGVAVVASLVYVGLQIRQNTAATRATSHQAVTDSLIHLNTTMARDPSVAGVWLRGAESRASLDPTGRWQFDMLALSFFHVFETIFYQSVVGAADRKFLLAEERSLKALFSTSGFREWWQENPFAFTPEFRKYVESFIEEPSNSARRS